MIANQNKGYMLRMQLNIISLLHCARNKNIPVDTTDMGYVVHCRLGELFGHMTPAPFTIGETQGEYITILAFTSYGKDELHSYARQFADPAAFESCQWENLHQKPMPDKWIPGLKLAFETRICPVRRMGRGSKIERGGAEVDAFIARCHTLNDSSVPVIRETVYREWLREQFEKFGAVNLISAQMRGFRRERLVRRTQGYNRKTRIIERPNVLFKGILEIIDSDKFNHMLFRGIGRHRKFGFGMVLLKPMRGESC